MSGLSTSQKTENACERSSETDTTFLNKNIFTEISREGLESDLIARKIVNIGLVNNMQGASNAATELYFRKLLSESAREFPVHLASFSPLEASAKNSLEPHQTSMEDLFNFEPDALIITGMEPSTPDLRQERLWRFMVKVLDWAESRAIPTILSCLAAHAAVLHGDGIERVPLKEKRFGVFEHRAVSDNVLTRGLPSSFRVPHSRWNELDASQLTKRGYQILTYSEGAGVDIFIKQRHSLFIHLQGHLEYTAETLCSEYKRDVRRFLAGARETYPALPQNYFIETDETALEIFRERAFKERNPEIWKHFPIGLGPAEAIAPWEEPARIIFQNLLKLIRH